MLAFPRAQRVRNECSRRRTCCTSLQLLADVPYMNGCVIWLAQGQTPDAVAPLSCCISPSRSTGFSPDLLTLLLSSSSKEAQSESHLVVDMKVDRAVQDWQEVFLVLFQTVIWQCIIH